MKVSIIMPVYNQRKDWFMEALDALSSQDYPDKQIIVSTIKGDPSSEWYKLFPDTKLVETRIPDPKRQINEAIKWATGDLIIQAASDDLMYPHVLSKMVQVFLDRNAILVYPDIEYCNEKLEMAYVHKAPQVFDMNNLRQRQIMNDCSLVSKSVLWEFGLFDISLSKFAVWDMWMKIGMKYPDRVIHAGCVAWKYRRHGNALGRTGHGEEFRERFYDKWKIDFRYRTLSPSFKAVVIE